MPEILVSAALVITPSTSPFASISTRPIVTVFTLMGNTSVAAGRKPGGSWNMETPLGPVAYFYTSLLHRLL
jgi:hypothetical protein